jgi:hypothetical protein
MPPASCPGDQARAIFRGAHKHVAQHSIESAGTWSRTLSSFKLRIAGFDASIRIEACRQPARPLEHRRPDVDFLRRST